MSVTIYPAQRLDGATVLLSWSSDQADAVFYVYRDGTLILTTAQTQLAVGVAPGDVAVFEVFDAADDLPALAASARVTLRWPAVDDAEVYIVRELVSGTWTQRARTTSRQWTSRPLEDSRVHQFRVVAVDAAANESTAASATVLMVRHPDPVSCDYEYVEASHAASLAAP